jgi:hypothetical protein
MRRIRQVGRLLATLTALAVLAPTCNNDQDQEELERAREFAACMREQGIDFPDPERDDQGAISGPAGPPDGDWEAFETAREICTAETGHRMD